MAARLNLRSADLPFIWNVSGRVGPGSDNPNNPTDVELMKLLLVILMGLPSIVRFGINGTSILPKNDSKFDPVLGFWIFRLQQLNRQTGGDGIASPARGEFFVKGSPWVIFTFNDLARQADRELWENLPRNRTVSPQLRAELTA